MTGTRVRGQRRDIDGAAGFVAARLADAVRETLATRSPQEARDVITELARFDDRLAATDEPSPGRVSAFLTLASRLNAVLPTLADGPERVEGVLEWVATDLGRPRHARPRRSRGSGHTDELWAYAEAQQDDFLPSLVWLLAAVEALYGDIPPTDAG
ncbi:MAG: hypothetical protein L0I76_24830 [Pseudonocardia sp.]|nr:hypothetical protein [Pseudonocardia sp.]